VAECTECGACCFSSLPTYARVLGDDHARLADAAERLTVFHGNRCYLRLVDGRCAALRVEGGRFLCSVYERRPEVCRSLAPGSAECLAEIELKGARTRAAQAPLSVRE